jgi:cytochrome c
MIDSRICAFLAATTLMSACGGPPSDGDGTNAAGRPGAVTAASLGAQVVLPTADYLQLPEYRNADRKLGAGLVMQCRACHSLKSGSPSISGPNLHGVFGRPVGEIEGYPYSPALAEAEFIWTPEALDAWLAQPWAFLPGNRMSYPGLAENSARDAVIAELLRLTTDNDEWSAP